MSNDHKTIGVHVTQPLLGILEDAAKNNRMKTSTFIRNILEDWNARSSGVRTIPNPEDTDSLIQLVAKFRPAYLQEVKEWTEANPDFDQSKLLDWFVGEICEMIEKHEKKASLHNLKIINLEYFDYDILNDLGEDLERDMRMSERTSNAMIKAIGNDRNRFFEALRPLIAGAKKPWPEDTLKIIEAANDAYARLTPEALDHADTRLTYEYIWGKKKALVDIIKLIEESPEDTIKRIDSADPTDKETI